MAAAGLAEGSPQGRRRPRRRAAPVSGAGGGVHRPWPCGGRGALAHGPSRQPQARAWPGLRHPGPGAGPRQEPQRQPPPGPPERRVPPLPARRRTPRRLLLPVPWKTGLRARWPSPCSGVACTDSGRLPALGRVAPVGAGASQTAQAPSGQAELSARRVRPDLILAGPRAPRGLRVH